MSQSSVEIIPLGNSHAVPKDGLLDKQTLIKSAEWLGHSIYIPDGSLMTVIDAFKLSYSFTESQLESKIEAAKKLQEMPDPPVDVPRANEPLGDDPLEKKDEALLLSWYLKECPKLHKSWIDFGKKFSDFVLKETEPRIMDRVHFLRTYLFGNCSFEGGTEAWKKLIDQSCVNEDKIKPGEIAKTVSSLSTRRKLRLLKPGTDDPFPEDYEVQFDDYLKTLGTDYAEKVAVHAQLLEWVIGYSDWRQNKTRTHIRRYELRMEKDNPWGEQAHWENVVRIRRMLEGMKITPPKLVLPFEEENMTEERIFSTLDSQPDHPLRSIPGLAKWYIKVNKKALDSRKRKSKNGKKKVTSNEYHEKIPNLIEYATFYQRWVKYNGKYYSFLEIIENAMYGRSHMIPPDLTVLEYETIFKGLLQQFKASTDSIEGFPKIPEWTKTAVDILFHSNNFSTAEGTALGQMNLIYEFQQDIIKKTKWSKENTSREQAQLPPLTYDEWLNVPTSSAGNGPRTSWITGRPLLPGYYNIVHVEGSRDAFYRRVIRLRDGVRGKFQETERKNTGIATEREEEPEELFVKCSVCSKDGQETEMDRIYMHRSHKKNFGAWSSRQRAEKVVDPDLANTIYKRKYAALFRTIRTWSEMPDADAPDIMKKMKSLVKRTKTGDLDSFLDPPIN